MTLFEKIGLFSIIALWLLLLSASAGSCLGGGRRDYDAFFERHAIANFGTAVRPSWIKAVAMAESNLDPAAVSWCGAKGAMQFMPVTWTDVAPEPWRSLGPTHPEAAIAVGCLYLRRLWNLYPAAAPRQRLALANAAYNSGPGNVKKARVRTAGAGADPDVWDAPHVEDHLVTRPASQSETRGYVRHIRAFEVRLEAEGGL